MGVAVLTHIRTGRRVTLASDTLVGRSPECRVAIAESVVSTHHAAFRWHGNAWWVRDLGSRNGTRLDGRGLGAGEEARVVVGSVLTFGDDSESWVLEESGAPVVAGERLGDGARAFADGGVLLLPNTEDPRLAIVQQATGAWFIDDDSGTSVADGDLVQAGEERWRISLPVEIERTVEARPAPVQMRFRVSSDEEYVEITLVDGGQETHLRPRSFNYLLLTLARLRLQDAELEEASRGWVDQERLARMLAIERNTVNVQVYRARQALGKIRDDLGMRLVERRSRTSQLRLGLDEVEIGST